MAGPSPSSRARWPRSSASLPRHARSSSSRRSCTTSARARTRRDPRQAECAYRGRARADRDAHGRGRVDRRGGGRVARRRRAHRSGIARAMGRGRISGRPRRPFDPAGGARRLLLRQLRRDDDRPSLPQGNESRRRRIGALGGRRVPVRPDGRGGRGPRPLRPSAVERHAPRQPIVRRAQGPASSARIRSSDFLISRETCIWEIPTRSAI